MPFISLDHPAIACRDVRRQIDWYCKHLGMRVIARNEQEPPSAIVGYDATAKGGAMIELMPASQSGANPGDLPRYCPGIRHVALRVSDFDQACAQLRSAGVQFLFEPTAALGGGRVVSFRDPEGNELQIVQR